ncbi:MAG: flagellar basal-body MS-ring/collar protein FliF [Pseudomonadota bacterium]
MRNLLAFLENFGLARLATTVGVTGGVALALILIMVRIGAEPYQILATDLDYADAQAVISELERGGQDYQMREHGARVSILVPRDRVGTIRLSLASEGLLNNSTVGYEIFDKQQSLGTTSFQQNLNRVRALEGELARSVSAISGVRSARVHLVLPERALFARDQQQPSASIMVDVTGRLGQGPIAAITNLVASAVPALSPNQITILDNRGNLLAAAHEMNSEAAQGAMISDRMAAAQTRLQTTVNDLIGRIVGPENVRARVAADFDVSRVTETAEIVDPDSQVVLSSTLIEESADDNRPARGVSVGNALPNATISDQIGDADRSQTRRTEEITNYEITKTVRNAVRDQGLVLNRVTVAVAINNRGDDGTITPLSPDTIARLEALVKSAVGFDATRGDQVDIVDVPFSPLTADVPATVAAPSPNGPLAAFSSTRIAELIALGLVALALIFFVIRPLFFAGHPTAKTQIAHRNIGTAPGANQSARTATLEDVTSSTQTASIADGTAGGDLEQRIDIAQVEGKVRASSVKRVQEIVTGHTEESATILKQWIREAV